MNYNKLNYFYTVAKTLNFTKAAEQLYISQSAISRHMKELEEDFGTPLFVRTNRNLILTEAGRVLYDEVSQFFSHEKDLYQKVRAASKADINKLNVGFMAIRPAYHIPSIVNDMLLQFPDLSVTLKRYNWSGFASALNSNKIDVGLRLRMGKDSSQDFEYFVLDIDYPAIVVSDRHPMAGKSHASISDFKDDTFLLLSKKESPIPYSYTQALLKKSGLASIAHTEYDEAETILMMIHADAGISLLSRFAATDQFPDLKIIDLDGINPLYCELVWRKNNNNPMISDFIERLKIDYQNRRKKELDL